MEVYQPAEDSYLIADVLKKHLKENEIESFLDMGTGSGILSEIALNAGVKDVVAVDINPDAVAEAEKLGARGIIGDLFENVSGEFDVISFNAPYLPLDSREPEDSQVATTGGVRGDEVSVRFLNGAQKHLKKNGKIFLLVSSLTPMDEISKFNPREVARKRVFAEDLIVLEIGQNP